MTLALALFLMFTAVGIFMYWGLPFIMKTVLEINKERAREFSTSMERTMMMEDIRRVQILFIVGPFVCAALGFVVTPPEYRFPGVLAGLVVGYIVPKIYANMTIAKRRRQFDQQLIDALLIMSSAFRGGMSFLQAMEAVVEEMPDPIRQEFGIVLGENKIGVTLEEALDRLQKRMRSTSLQQVISAILLARETGGNLPLIFSRIVHTIREKKKLEQQLEVLTLQGRIQAFVMSGLPVGFFFLVNSTNPQYFQIMTGTDIGQKLLVLCVFLWVVGTFMILKISAYRNF
ncbi:MAG: hypothetical protein GX606_02825 [Elusimicrobia bacterium]|nr:hypothetical protein [Elusimicrobiota bacterium]